MDKRQADLWRVGISTAAIVVATTYFDNVAIFVASLVIGVLVVVVYRVKTR